ncbi:MAG: tlde1 domain-containing protein [Roseiarcus sp.]
MQGIDATFDELSLEGGDSPRRVLLKILPGAAAVALAGAVGVWMLHWRGSAVPEAVISRWTPASTVAPPAPAFSKPFGDIVIDASLLAQLKVAAPAAPSPQVASLEAAPPASYAPIPLPSLEPFASAPAPAIPAAGSLPVPPARDLPEIGESFPLPPPRPPEFITPTQPLAPERHASRPEVTIARPAPAADNRNFLEKLFGLGRQSSPEIASAAPARATSQPILGEQRQRDTTGLARGPLLGFPSPFGGSAPSSGYDRYTAVYDISARVVYLPDGTRLEAHSGLGDALDNPRYVSERARGPTPPHLYELALREGSFHGVQALRLNPIGDGGLYGRAGFLAHPFMLGANGDSNGCVSFKDYQAFLRAYQNGHIKNLAVVAKL